MIQHPDVTDKLKFVGQVCRSDLSMIQHPDVSDKLKFVGQLVGQLVGHTRGLKMTLYRWDSTERRFSPTPVKDETPPSERVLTKQVRVSKGERTCAEVATGDLFIRVVTGSWRMQIANTHLTVRQDEAVVIPSGFSHSAEATEDSLAVQMIDARDHIGDESLWAV